MATLKEVMDAAKHCNQKTPILIEDIGQQLLLTYSHLQRI